ncbi:MAG: outer membrane protein assembly factor BamA [Oligoflexia bacterium]|nr:outer membrane protein assembly factor BamA [Oligoflexia bacterium]
MNFGRFVRLILVVSFIFFNCVTIATARATAEATAIPAPAEATPQSTLNAPASVYSSEEEYLIKLTKNFFRIDDIEVRGNKKIEKEAILEKVHSKKGVILDNKMLRDDIESIYKMKYFENVEAHHEMRDKKNVLVFVIKERPIIKSISFSGNSELSTEDIKEKVKSKEFSILDINSIKNDVSELKKFYEEKGYYLVSVDYEIKKTTEENVEVVFKIKEFEKVKVKKITVLGNRAFSDNEIKEIMRTREESIISFMTDYGNFKEFDFETDIERIKYFYKTKGYLQVNLGKPLITVSEDKRWLFITFKINEGPQFSVNKIFYDGDMLFPEDTLKEKTSLKESDIYSEETLRKDIQILSELYQDEGYAFANVIRNLDIVPGENKVDVRFSFEKGKIAYFGKIIMKGNTETRDKVIRRELLVREGMKFSGSALRKSRENVKRLGFFDAESVVLNTVTVKDRDDLLNLEISVKERGTGQIQVGAGYSTASQAFFQASISKKNFRGLGQDLSFTLNFAKRSQEYRFGFVEPYLFDSQWTGGGDIFYRKDIDLNDTYSFEKGFDLRIGYPIFDYTRLYLVYSFIEKKITDITDPTVDIDKENGIASSVKTLLEYDRRNDRWDPSGGFFGRLSYEYVGIGGDKFWSSTELDVRYYKSVIEDLILRTRMLAAQLYERNKKEVPSGDRLYLGGARTLRGYEAKDVGPFKRAKARNAVEDEAERKWPLGGLFSLLGTVEFEYPLVREAGLKGAVFTDAGNVYDSYIGKKGDYSLRYDWGFGFRWFSPIGLLRFEFAYPIRKKEKERSSQFYFDIGQVF